MKDYCLIPHRFEKLFQITSSICEPAKVQVEAQLSHCLQLLYSGKLL